MLELKGKYNEAKIFTDIVDEASISQVLLLLNQEFVSEIGRASCRERV